MRKLITFFALVVLLFNTWFFVGLNDLWVISVILIGFSFLIFTHFYSIEKIRDIFFLGDWSNRNILFKMYFISALQTLFMIIPFFIPVIVREYPLYSMSVSISAIGIMTSIFIFILHKTKKIQSM